MWSALGRDMRDPSRSTFEKEVGVNDKIPRPSTNVTKLHKTKKVEFKENQILDLSRAQETVFIVQSGSIRFERQATVGTNTRWMAVCSYQQGEFISTGTGDEVCDRYTVEIPGEYFEMTREDFEQNPKLNELFRETIRGTWKQHGRMRAALVQAFMQNMEKSAEIEKLKNEVDALKTNNLFLEETLEEEGNSHLTTRQNLDSTTALLNKMLAANETLHKMKPDVYAFIDEMYAKMHKEADKFLPTLNAVLATLGQPERTWDQIGPILKALEVSLPLVEDEVEDVFVIEEESEPIPLTPPVSVVSNGPKFRSGERVETRIGVSDNTLGSTQAWERPKKP